MRILLPADSPGQDLYRFDLYATGVFVACAVLAAVFPVLHIPFAVVSSVLFAAGTVAFLMAYGRAITRSREEDVSVANIYAMSGSTPKPIQRRFHALTVLQTTAAVVTSAIHPFTPQAFGILAPMLGLGLAGLWAARHGRFAERKDGPNYAKKQARETTRG